MCRLYFSLKINNCRHPVLPNFLKRSEYKLCWAHKPYFSRVHRILGTATPSNKRACLFGNDFRKCIQVSQMIQWIQWIAECDRLVHLIATLLQWYLLTDARDRFKCHLMWSEDLYFKLYFSWAVNLLVSFSSPLQKLSLRFPVASFKISK